MAERLDLSLQQRLQQKLSPLQVQYVRLLEMSGAELEDEVRRALDDNPALEQVETEAPADTELYGADDEAFNESSEELQRADYASEDDIPSYRLETHNVDKDTQWHEPVAVDSGESLFEYVMAQLRQGSMSERELTLARLIVGNLDDNGYLTRTPSQLVDDAAMQEGLTVSIGELRQVWDAVKACEPPGVGAADLRECLILQLRQMEQRPVVSLALEIIRDYYDVFSLMHYQRLASMLGISIEELREALDVIKGLNPKPGSALTGNESEDRLRHITPDFVVEVDGESVTLSMVNTPPHLQIEQTFASVDEVKPGQRLTRGQLEGMAFIKQKRDEADLFIKVVGMRQNTLYRVMTAIMRHQRDFFLTGDELKLRPMILKDIAQETGYDVSVVSRATQGKYVATQHGVYPLKFFFNERPKDDVDMSMHEILAALRIVIEKEDKSHPLSDEELTKQMKAQGYDIARRTVAKYREKLGLPVARLRRQL
ncbi:MAG: RNA polymerase factor sigma-54 [Bacteroidales bacterium]|nr:RNA polymerase factor sigma-54 [Bacteroidales bacterium]